VNNQSKLINKLHAMARDCGLSSCDEAADEIERLRADNHRLRKWRTEWDCRYTMGNVADIDGSHCLDAEGEPKRCRRCEFESEIEILDGIRERSVILRDAAENALKCVEWEAGTWGDPPVPCVKLSRAAFEKLRDALDGKDDPK
jgi:hypothetical protein